MATARMYGRGMDRRRVPEGSPGSPGQVLRAAQAALEASGVEPEELDERELPATNASGAATVD